MFILLCRITNATATNAGWYKGVKSGTLISLEVLTPKIVTNSWWSSKQNNYNPSSIYRQLTFLENSVYITTTQKIVLYVKTVRFCFFLPTRILWIMRTSFSLINFPKHYRTSSTPGAYSLNASSVPQSLWQPKMPSHISQLPPPPVLGNRESGRGMLSSSGLYVILCEMVMLGATVTILQPYGEKSEDKSQYSGDGRMHRWQESGSLITLLSHWVNTPWTYPIYGSVIMGDDKATLWLSHCEWSPLFLVVKSTLILTSYFPFSGSWCLHLCCEDFLI